MHLGNVEFVESINSDKEDVTIVSQASAESLAAAAELLGFDRETLAERLVNRTIIVGNKVISSIQYCDIYIIYRHPLKMLLKIRRELVLEWK